MNATPNAVLKHALEHIGRGWAIFPLHAVDSTGQVCTCKLKRECPEKNRGKHPANGDGFKSATVGEPEARKTFKAGDRNIGIATGQASGGLFAIDIDPGDGGIEQLAKLESELGALPSTAQARTGSGGTHYLFRTSETDLSISAGKNGGPFGAGVDHRSDGGSIVGVGSRSGRGPYTWVEGHSPDETPLAELPAAWVKRIRDHQNAGRQQAQEAARQREVTRGKRVFTDIEAAREAYNRANSRDWGHKTKCLTPGCPGNHGFGNHGKLKAIGKWSCRSPDHPETVGKKGDGHYLGDALDLDAALHGRSTTEHLIETGYLVRRTKAAGGAPGGGGPASPSATGAPSAQGGQPPQSSGILPAIFPGAGQLRDVVAEAWAALEAHNNRGANPELFIRGRQILRVVPSKNQGLQVVDAGVEHLCNVLKDAADWLRISPDGSEQAARPDLGVLTDMVTAPSLRLPELTTMLGAPVVGRSGQIIDRPRYHPAEKVWLDMPRGAMEPVPEKPTQADVDAAKHLVLDQLLADFPFWVEADKANAVAFLLTGFLQPFINDHTPLHAISANRPRIGKTELAKVQSELLLGSPLSTATYDTDDKEMHKAILTRFFHGGAPLYVLDNVAEEAGDHRGRHIERLKVRSPVLNQVLTTGCMEGRIITSKAYPKLNLLNVTWAMTGNNLQLDDELSARSTRIHLMRFGAGGDYVPPGGWKLPVDPNEWARRNRWRIVRALLVLVQSWLAAGQPTWAGLQINGFNRYCQVLGGILQHVGIPGFLDNYKYWQTSEYFSKTGTGPEASGLDPHATKLLKLFDLWWSRYQGKHLKGREVLQLVDEDKDLQPQVVAKVDDRPSESPEDRQKRELKARGATAGKFFEARAGKRFGPYILRRARPAGANSSEAWLERVAEAPFVENERPPGHVSEELQREIWGDPGDAAHA